MSNTKGPAHDNVVLQLVPPSLLQPTGRTGFHDFAHIGGQLADAGTDLTRADPDDHALGVAGSGMAGCGCLRIVGTNVRSLLCSSSRHDCWLVTEDWEVWSVQAEAAMKVSQTRKN